MELQELRLVLDDIDSQFLALLARRMETIEQVAQVKRARHLPIYDPQREQEKLARLTEQAGPELAQAARALFSLLFELSRASQSRLLSQAPREDDHG